MTESLDTAQARQNRQLHQAVRNLATQIGRVSAKQRSSETRKATVVAVNYNKTTGQVTTDLNLSGDTSVVVPAVNVVQGVSPNVGDVVNVLKQDATMSVVSQIGTATGGGWTAPTLASGISDNGDSEGHILYRIINDNGSLKMQWQGAVSVTGSVTSLLGTALATTYRPAYQRKLIAARGLGNGAGIVAQQVVFGTDGTVKLSGTTAVLMPSHTHGMGTSDTQLSGYLSQAGSDLGHAHGLGTSAAAQWTDNGPDWVSFNGLEYFL